MKHLWVRCPKSSITPPNLVYTEEFRSLSFLKKSFPFEVPSIRLLQTDHSINQTEERKIHESD